MFTLIPVIILVLCTKADPSNIQEIRQLTCSHNEFTSNLLKSFCAQGNFFISPTSIYMVLSMLNAGAKTRTADELRNVMRLSSLPLPDTQIHQTFKYLLNLLQEPRNQYTLEIANAIFSQVEYHIVPTYKEILQYYYNALSMNVDFISRPEEAINSINCWASEKTHGKIPEVIREIKLDTKLIFLNAVYFKGSWKIGFDPKDTCESQFFNNGRKQVFVPTMYVQDIFRYGKFKDEGFKIIQLPYEGDKVSMTIILPLQREGLPFVEQRLSASKIDYVISELKESTIDVRIPKFTLEYSEFLTDKLVQLGMKSAFESTADLSGITKNKGLFVSDMMQKAFIEVNEEGTEAAAVTGMVQADGFGGTHFTADHPFLFIIREEQTGLILFVGRVNELQGI